MAPPCACVCAHEYDNPPIGIILCADKNNVRAQYALGGLSNAIFTSTYTLRVPDEEQLEDQVRRVIGANDAICDCDMRLAWCLRMSR